MVRDVVEASHRLVKEEMMESVKEQAEELANEAIVKLLVPSLRKKTIDAKSFRNAVWWQRSAVN